MTEADLYEPTERFVRSKMSCWQTRTKAGVADVGEVDVLGVRYVGGDLSGQSEVIAVEVKLNASRFAVSAGQAHGYSVAAERCYLAAITPAFTPTQVLIASRIGIGLIRISHTPSGAFRFSEVLSAPAGIPVEELLCKQLSVWGSLRVRSAEGSFGDMRASPTTTVPFSARPHAGSCDRLRMMPRDLCGGLTNKPPSTVGCSPAERAEYGVTCARRASGRWRPRSDDANPRCYAAVRRNR